MAQVLPQATLTRVPSCEQVLHRIAQKKGRLMALYAASTILSMQACDPSSAFFGFMGVTSAIVFANLGAAYGTAKSGVGISSMGVMRPDMIMRSIIPVVMAGVLGIYGLI